VKGRKNMQTNQPNQDQMILLGVPKVQYCPEGLTPFPSCLRACANYMGIDVSYDYTMTASGAAFRLTWDETHWNLGNVDSIYTYDEPERVFKQGIEKRILKKKNLSLLSKVKLIKGIPLLHWELSVRLKPALSQDIEMMGRLYSDGTFFRTIRNLTALLLLMSQVILSLTAGGKIRIP